MVENEASTYALHTLSNVIENYGRYTDGRFFANLETRFDFLMQKSFSLDQLRSNRGRVQLFVELDVV